MKVMDYLDVSNVSDSTHGHARLRSTLVGTSLQTNDGLSSFQLLFTELTDVLLCWLGSNDRAIKTVTLALKLNVSSSINTGHTVSSLILLLYDLPQNPVAE